VKKEFAGMVHQSSQNTGFRINLFCGWMEGSYGQFHLIGHILCMAVSKKITIDHFSGSFKAFLTDSVIQS
jgi:hypothetical protein